MRFKKKKASLALSMNAIVVIILAMAMLGVGMYIVTRVQTEVSDVFDEKNLADPTETATSLKVITAAYEQFPVKQGESNSKKFSVFNPDTVNSVALSMNCTGTTGITLTPATVTILSKTADTKILKVDVASTVIPDDYICTITVGSTSTNTEDFIIVVKS